MLARFDMDVGCSVGHGLGHHRVDQPDDRGILDGGVEVALFVLVAGGVDDAGHRLNARVHARVLLDRRLDVGGGRDDRQHVTARDRSDIVERIDVRGVRHRDQETAVAFADRQGPIPAGEGVGQQRRRDGVDLEVGEVDELEPDLFGERSDEVGLLDHPEVDQDAAE